MLFFQAKFKPIKTDLLPGWNYYIDLTVYIVIVSAGLESGSFVSQRRSFHAAKLQNR